MHKKPIWWRTRSITMYDLKKESVIYLRTNEVAEK